MATVKSCTAPIITDPVGVDAICQSIQLQLAIDLDWIEKSYGKALVIRDNRIEDGVSTDYVIPKVYKGGREFIPIEPDDSVTAFSFLYETIGAPEISQGSFYKSQTNLNLVVFANTERISEVSEDYLFIEVLKEQVKESLYRNDSVRLSILEDTLQVFKHFDDTWTDFDINNGQNKWLKHNYATFRINFDVSYEFNCPVTISGGSLLLEDGQFFILLESGDKILLENG